MNFEDYKESNEPAAGEELSGYPVGVYYIDTDRMYMHKVLPHSHPELELLFIREGSARVFISGESFILSSGDGLFINSERIHSIESSTVTDSCVMLSVLFDTSYLFEDENSFLSVKYMKPLKDDPALPFIRLNSGEENGIRILSYLKELLDENLGRAYGYELKTKSLLCELWMLLLSLKAGIPSDPLKASSLLTDEKRSIDMMSFMKKNLRKKLTLEDIAASVNVSRSECCRCFKRCTSISPFDYLQDIRIHEAASRLQKSKTALSMQKLSAQTGFASPSYFNRIFKSRTALTPLEYRQLIKKSHRDALNPYGIPLNRL
ncbi:MAG: AraC family transcriptional regulator [Lachnospiraceae bacterium]|nr:AraC family transcriptional regulator [Lachnospiraceae bacterium]MCR4937249.1 AraC family transcriptional regulator [Lachnospiraceae bacterium]